ncbi:helix-turn-helix domain-containing protein [Aquimarina sediminis]|uniref:helix-turn-helix domain-containing protein n=1 Tax=Aquimarina sediminis TaxID=2070536 RepID=UPI000CA0869E|nr:AraC family transcriptional regulator [Aquimarina sediminis]
MHYKHTGKNNGLFELIDTATIKYSSNKLLSDCYKVVWARNDSITLGVDGYRIFLDKNHLLFLSQLNTVEFEIAHKDIIIYSFNREFYCIRDHDAEVSCNGFLFLGSSSPLIVELSEKEQKSFHLLYDFFVEEFETMDHIQGEMLLVLLKRLLIKSVRIARKLLPKEDMPKSKLNAIRKFNLLVEMHFREKHKVSDYATLMHVTPKSLSNLFSRYFHKSPLKIINERLILESKRLLEFSDKNINEIGYILGFNEISHFSKFFKTHVGLSPTEYQNIYVDKKNL